MNIELNNRNVWFAKDFCLTLIVLSERFETDTVWCQKLANLKPELFKQQKDVANTNKIVEMENEIT